MSGLDDIAGINDKKALILGTAAEMKSGQDWFIQVPNGKYDIKIVLKIVDNKANKSVFASKTPMDFMINDMLVTTAPLGVRDEMVHDKKNVKITTSEIRLKWIKGIVSFSSIEIIPQQDVADVGAVKKEVFKNTFIGGDCLKDGKNCLFDETQLTLVKCDGVFVKIGAKATVRDMACL